MRLDERPRGSARPAPKQHYNSLPTTSLEAALVYPPRIYAQIIAVVLILVGVLGCGAGGGSAGGGGEAEDTQAPSDAKESVVKTVRVKEAEFALKPAEITLQKPGTYLFKAVNSGGTVHALEVEGVSLQQSGR